MSGFFLPDAPAGDCGPAEAVSFREEKYVWLPCHKVTPETLDEVLPPAE